MHLLTRQGVAIAVACLAATAGAAWAWNAVAQRDARIAALQAQLHAAAEAGALHTRELAQCRAAAVAAPARPPSPHDAASAQPVEAPGTRAPQLAATGGTPAGAPMDLGAALKAFQAAQPAPGSAGLSPFAAQR